MRHSRRKIVRNWESPLLPFALNLRRPNLNRIRLQCRRQFAGEIDGKTSYKSYWVTLKEKPYQSVKDLQGKPIAFSGKTSTSGYVIPLWDLRQKNLISDSGKAEEFFGAGNVWFGSGYVSAVERVLNGDAEAAAVSYYVSGQGQASDP